MSKIREGFYKQASLKREEHPILNVINKTVYLGGNQKKIKGPHFTINIKKPLLLGRERFEELRKMSPGNYVANNIASDPSEVVQDLRAAIKKKTGLDTTVKIHESYRKDWAHLMKTRVKDNEQARNDKFDSLMDMGLKKKPKFSRNTVFTEEDLNKMRAKS